VDVSGCRKTVSLFSYWGPIDTRPPNSALHVGRAVLISRQSRVQRSVLGANFCKLKSRTRSLLFSVASLPIREAIPLKRRISKGVHRAAKNTVDYRMVQPNVQTALGKWIGCGASDGRREVKVCRSMICKVGPPTRRKIDGNFPLLHKLETICNYTI
jgi:hypothetical protein